MLSTGVCFLNPILLQYLVMYINLVYDVSYHMGLQCCELSRLINAVIRHVVENSVLHKDADGSTYEGGEEVNVDVVTGAVETPQGERDKRYEVQLFYEFLSCLLHVYIFN